MPPKRGFPCVTDFSFVGPIFFGLLGGFWAFLKVWAYGHGENLNSVDQHCVTTVSVVKKSAL